MYPRAKYLLEHRFHASQTHTRDALMTPRLSEPRLNDNHRAASEVEKTRLQAVYARRKRHSSRYSWFDDAHLLLAQERERQVLKALKRHGVFELNRTRILEVGSGSGHWLREFIKWGARPENVTGIDLIEQRVAQARRLCPDRVVIECGYAGDLRFPGEVFDLVLQSTVFSSILDTAIKRQVASEMLRVLKKDGIILWYDMRVNNPSNPDVRGIRKHEVRQLFPGCRIQLRRITLAPFRARLLASQSWLLCSLLAEVPWLCTHYLGVIRKV
jgi:ubiquinone/menaquinone biosynthesis C-methylase UbiE